MRTSLLVITGFIFSQTAFAALAPYKSYTECVTDVYDGIGFDRTSARLICSKARIVYADYGSCVSDVYNGNGYDRSSARRSCERASITYPNFKACVDDVYKDNGYDRSGAHRACTLLHVGLRR